MTLNNGMGFSDFWLFLKIISRSFLVVQQVKDLELLLQQLGSLLWSKFTPGPRLPSLGATKKKFFLNKNQFYLQRHITLPGCTVICKPSNTDLIWIREVKNILFSLSSFATCHHLSFLYVAYRAKTIYLLGMQTIICSQK